MTKVINNVDPFSGSGTYSEIDLYSDTPVPMANRAEISAQVGEYIVDKINEYLSRTTSPVSGKGSFKGLSEDYAAYKKDQGQRAIPDLELTGNMRDALTYKVTGYGVQVGLFGSQAMKADGHNNFSGRSELPLRQFLPKKDESFKREITLGIQEIVAKASLKQGALALPDLSSVTTKSEFDEVLRKAFPGLSRTAISRVILESPALVDQLENMGFLKWL